MRAFAAVCTFVLVAACSSDSSDPSPAGATSAGHATAAGATSAGHATAAGSSDGGSNAGGSSGGGSGDGGSSDGGSSDGGSSAAGSGDGEPTAAALLALTSSCTKAGGDYATDDDGSPETIPICRLPGAFFWTADMDVDCDGKTTASCNLAADPAYQDETSFTDADDQPLDAATLPYVVVPLPSQRFDYMAAEIKPGAAVVVVYQGQVAYGVFGDEGPENIIGEASYAMAKSLGVDPDPSFGGTDGPVTYIVFTGDAAAVSPIEDHAAAVALGKKLASQLLAP